MVTERTRRAVIVGSLAAGIGGLSLSGARGLLESFAPLSGDVWEAAGRERSERVASPYGEATVRIDDEGVPHVEANDEAAAYFAVGYCHGFDRTFQLDLGRRVMRGRLSEIVGEATLEDDEFHLSMDFVGAAEATWDGVRETPAGSLIEAYADGVNAAIETEQLPLEFQLLEYEPEPWTPVDTMLMEKQIAWTLTGNFDELREALVADRLGEDLAAALYPERMDHDVPILRESDRLGTIGGLSGGAESNDGNVGSPADSSDELGGSPAGSSDDEPTGDRTERAAIGPALLEWLSRFESPPGVGSNSWVVSGEHTSSGRPIVANDPHLPLMTPPLWYEQHVQTPETSVRGVTFPGVPFVLIGANEHGAWGFTNVGADVLDCYTYEFSEDRERYRYRGEWRELETERRELPVAGAEDRSLLVSKTVHGPVLEREGRTVGVSWTGLTATRTTEAIYAYARSEGLEDVLEATEYFDLPTQNLVYADADGRTCYYVTGKLPIRTVDGEPVSGHRLFDGSTGEGEWEGFTPYGESSWEGFVPFEEQPHAIDPDLLATANQRVADEPAHYIGVDYATPYRGARIDEFLEAYAESGEPIDPGVHRDLQRDVHDGRAAAFVPDLLEAVSEADAADELGDAAETLEAWDGRMHRDSRGALLFARWLHHYRRATFEPTFADAGLDASYYPNDWVLARLPEEREFFTEASRAETMVDALRETVSELDAEGWDRYGDWNTTGAVEHPFGSEAPFLNYEERPTDGSAATVDNYRFESAVGASWKQVVEPGGEAWGILPGGNSGDYFSPHYDDQFTRWADGEYKPMALEPAGEVAITFEEGSS
ncbi:penicillin acylase family protein [Natronobeatus ordinarius]|uniref:penicillin acylase family protein n=1 Tax=Natronobeatus ordinarius TaxID=2963433 RepID=UPI0020CF8150|nr:penicillin acylase family protein [Natronobeatus ordinarius]